MTEITEENVELIFPEMMAHPVLFTHPNPKKIVLLGDSIPLILHEVLKHTHILEIHKIEPHHVHISNNGLVFNSTMHSLINDSIDVIINASDVNVSETKEFFELLHKDGILIQQSVSPFAINPLKSYIQVLQQVGFSDIQLLSFPQPNYATGWRSILMALKNGMFKRLREKVIFNKPFKTKYYNFDVHRAATVLPEFIRDSNIF